MFFNLFNDVKYYTYLIINEKIAEYLILYAKMTY